ncbi:hypothetical protein [Algoriphagus sp. CAU 1675]|uniref:hypothetical protein n=1 Tax=Algoriphagus sp. CAU 1675 TaxID=3032597 RepID=UPI0023DBD83F|nr:hypothetical protein [Algoriphagus sp. CAU 1675]MDF2157811.1 hypothetical protein [Algoriphagus sp. CAU 1675]
MKTEFRLFLKQLWPFILVIVVIPFLSFAWWYFTPSKVLGVIILDKTVVDDQFREHSGLVWTLNHDKYTKADGSFYQKESDYNGFFPDPKTDSGQIRDFSQFSDQQIAELIEKNELFFLTDTYGQYAISQDSSDEKAVYGGLNESDLKVLGEAIKQEKTIVAEYNSMASPTEKLIRAEFENLMGLTWTGWIARYFEELDPSLNSKLPEWLVTNYENQKNEAWDKSGSGMVFIKDSGEMEVFLTGEDFMNQTPVIRSPRMNKEGFNLPQAIPYPDWFDIVLIKREYEVISYYDINPSDQGLQRLRGMGLPRYFPAAVVRTNGKGKIYYFSGDFSDSPADLGSPEFMGTPYLWRGFFLEANFRKRQSFFWNYYYPLVSQLIEKIYQPEE